jgi:hypothetical protein
MARRTCAEADALLPTMIVAELTSSLLARSSSLAMNDWDSENRKSNSQCKSQECQINFLTIRVPKRSIIVYFPTLTPTVSITSVSPS